MKTIIAYLILILIFLALIFILPELIQLPNWYLEKLLFVNSALIGSLGGVLYCLRAIYLNKCVHKRWDEEWNVWYFLRPITSLISGLISSLFLMAGLLTLDAINSGSSAGYLAVAFIAGYNVDNFLKKIEDVAKTVWGIDKSRVGNDKN